MAQPITGMVADGQHHPLPYARLELKSASDSTMVVTGTSDSKGAFSLATKAGDEYMLKVSCIGYQTLQKRCKSGNVGIICLEQKSTLLHEAGITASRIRNEVNGYTINLRSSELSKGKQAEEILPLLPYVSKENGIFKINGIPVSDIYIDGVKLSNLDELKNLPAEMIDKVKVSCLATSQQNVDSDYASQKTVAYRAL